MTSIVLGIDPGSLSTGYGIISHRGDQLAYISSGCIRTLSKDMPMRLKIIYSGISKIITQFHPNFFAIEQVFMAKNPNAVLKLGQARGVAILSAIHHNLNVFEYAAREVKQAVVGTGAAEKSQVQHMIRSLLNLSSSPGSDAADALAIAIAHCHLSQGVLKMHKRRLGPA